MWVGKGQQGLSEAAERWAVLSGSYCGSQAEGTDEGGMLHPSYLLEDWTTEGLSEAKATAQDDVPRQQEWGEFASVLDTDPTKHGLTLVITINGALSMLILSITKILTTWF